MTGRPAEARRTARLFLPPGGDLSELDRELDAAHRAGLADIARVDRAPVPSFDTGPALRFPRQGQFHIVKYIQGLAAAAQRDGVIICNGTHARAFQGGAEAQVETDRGTVRARALVIATNSPVNDLVAIHTKQAAYRTYAVGARVPRGSVPAILLCDTLENVNVAGSTSTS